MVDDRIHEDADPMPVGRVHHRAEVVPGTQRRIYRGPVAGPIAVVSVCLTGSLVDACVDLFHEGCDPDGGHAQAVEVPLLDLLEHAGEIATFEVAELCSVMCAA
jgi:hypothetical protein